MSVNKDPKNLVSVDTGRGILVPAGGTANIYVQLHPTEVVLPYQILIPADLVEHFSILDIKVGRRSQIGDAGPLPADWFVDNLSAKGISLKWSDVSPSEFFTLSVKNIGGTDRIFRATIVSSVVP